MLPIGLTELGTTLEVETPTERVRAVVVEKPFIDPKKETPKQAVGPAPG
jgi:aminomethyltransferase